MVMKRAETFLIITMLFILFSCQTQDHLNPPESSVNREEESLPPETEGIPDPVEVNGVIDFRSEEYRFLWDTAPKGDVPVFFASSPRREFRDEEASYCLFDAARQVSLFHAARIETKQAVKSNNKDLGYKESVKSGFDRDLALKLMKDLKVISYFRDLEGSYMLVEDPSLTVNIPYTGEFISGGDEPPWAIEVPEIEGMLVSVGVVQRSQYLSSSLKRADDQALANLSRQVSINVKSKRTDLEVQSGTAFAETRYDVSSSILKGFYVLARWRTGDGNTYYSLAVCKKGIKE